MDDLQIASFNLYGAPFNPSDIKKTLFKTHIKVRCKLIAEMLNTSSADILLLQEVIFYSELRIVKKYLSNFPFIAYKPFLLGPKGGLVIFSKIPLIDISYDTFQNLGPFLNKSIAMHIIKSGFLIASLKDRPLSFINTHLTASFDFDWSPGNMFLPTIISQLGQIESVIKKRKDTHDIVLAGDFNIPGNNIHFQNFVEKIIATNPFQDFSNPTFRDEYVPKGKKSGRIDHMLLVSKTGNAKLIKPHHIFEEKLTLPNGESYFPSDHIGLKAQLIQNL